MKKTARPAQVEPRLEVPTGRRCLSADGREKVAYYRRSDARRAARRTTSFGNSRPGAVRDYRCTDCGLFHVGHPPKKKDSE